MLQPETVDGDSGCQWIFWTHQPRCESKPIVGLGPGYLYLGLLDGIIDFIFFPMLFSMRWDTCSGEALLMAVDGCLTDLTGQAISYDHNDEPSAFQHDRGFMASRSTDFTPGLAVQ